MLLNVNGKTRVTLPSICLDLAMGLTVSTLQRALTKQLNSGSSVTIPPGPPEMDGGSSSVEFLFCISKITDLLERRKLESQELC